LQKGTTITQRKKKTVGVPVAGSAHRADNSAMYRKVICHSVHYRRVKIKVPVRLDVSRFFVICAAV
jgi:hypothetical protein